MENAQQKFNDAFVVQALSALEQGKWGIEFFHAGFIMGGEFKCERISFSTDGRLLKVKIPDPRGELPKTSRKKREPNPHIEKIMLVVPKKNILQACYRALSLLFHNMRLCEICNSLAMYATECERANHGIVIPPCVVQDNCFCYLYILEGEKICSRCKQYTVLNMPSDTQCVICLENFSSSSVEGGDARCFLAKGCAQCKTLICTRCYNDKKIPASWKSQCRTCKKDFFAVYKK